MHWKSHALLSYGSAIKLSYFTENQTSEYQSYGLLVTWNAYPARVQLDMTEYTGKLPIFKISSQLEKIYFSWRPLGAQNKWL